MLKRREALLAGLFGTGYVGLRALATGLPAWFIANPRAATAQDLECAIAARENMQYLIVSASSAGDPMNCNCPGTYGAGADGDNPAAAGVVHPGQVELAPTPVTLGARTYTAALPWASTEVGGALAPATLARTSFFHYMTRSTVHGDQPKVMRLMGQTSGGEMIVSAYAKHLGACLATVQTEPIAVGARNNASELVSFSGRTLPAITPTQLKQLLTGSRNDPLVQLRPLRDQALNQLNALAKDVGGATNVQKQFLDQMAASQTQVRALAEALATTLMAITADDVAGQALAAAALISANVTPVVTMRIPFGGDNHTDAALQDEVDQHITGAQGIQAVQDALAGLGLTDRVTFAMLNVFGRNLNANDKLADVNNLLGRDHYGSHAVAVLIGKNVAPGVIGGVGPVASSGRGGVATGALGASDIDSATGAAVTGGDIKAVDTHVALARTLGVALGIESGAMAGDFVASAAGGKVVNPALNGVSG